MSERTILVDNTCQIKGTKSDKINKCARPEPGGALGGCAFDGAQITLLQISDALHIAHSPSTCIGCSYNNRGTRSTIGALYRYGITTDMNEIDIIMGSEEKLIKTIKECTDIFKPKAIFVYSTCVADMTGFDLIDAAKKAQNIVKIPVIPVDSPGFIGNKNYGNKKAGEALFKYVIGTKEPKDTTDTDICIIADYNIAGELWRILPYCEELGIRVLSKITGDATYEEVAYAHRSRCNMVVCSRALVSLAKSLKLKYGTEYFEGSFYGVKETSNALRKIGEILNIDHLKEKIECFVQKKEKEVEQALKFFKRFFKNKRVFIYSGGVKSWSMVMQLEELGFEVIGSGIRKSSTEDIEKLKRHFEGKQKILMEKGDGQLLLDILEKNKADLFIAGSRNLYVAMKGQIPYLDVNQERIKAYAGYEGMITLAGDIYHTMNSKVFKTVKNNPSFLRLI